MSSKVDRIGEIGYNTFGSKMVIIEYRKYSDIDIYFPEYNWIAKNREYRHFKKGNVRCPYERRIFNIGYLGEGKYKSKENGKNTRVYDTWHNMLQRCYDEKCQEKNPTYIGCEVSENFHDFQNFGDWNSENYYEIEGEQMCLDKDILVKHNKIYSPETCVFVPQTINKLFTKRQNDRGASVIGASLHKNSKSQVRCHMINPETGKSQCEYLGLFHTQEKAFEVYKYYKEKNIKQVADYFKGLIPEILYDALYNYEVEIND